MSSEETQFKKGDIPWNLGIPCSEEAKIKISKSNLGRKLSEEQKRRISKGHKGLPSWKKGLTRETDKRINLPWNTGLTKETDIRLKKHSERMKGKRSDEFKQKRRDYMLDGHAVYVVSHVKNPSKPQLKLYNYIKQIYPSAILNYPIKVFDGKHYSLDVAIPELKVDFEYDGEYWHSDKSHGKNCEIRDFFRDDNLIEQGWSVVRINGQEELNKVMS